MPAFCTQFDLDILVVTRGAKGAVACNRQGHLVSAKPPSSSYGGRYRRRGRRFAALLLLGLSKQWPIEVTLDRAQAFACALVGRRGATVADREFYRAFSEQWD